MDKWTCSLVYKKTGSHELEHKSIQACSTCPAIMQPACATPTPRRWLRAGLSRALIISSPAGAMGETCRRLFTRIPPPLLWTRMLTLRIALLFFLRATWIVFLRARARSPAPRFTYLSFVRIMFKRMRFFWPVHLLQTVVRGNRANSQQPRVDKRALDQDDYVFSENTLSTKKHCANGWWSTLITYCNSAILKGRLQIY